MGRYDIDETENSSSEKVRLHPSSTLQTTAAFLEPLRSCERQWKRANRDHGGAVALMCCSRVESPGIVAKWPPTDLDQDSVPSFLAKSTSSPREPPPFAEQIGEG